MTVTILSCMMEIDWSNDEIRLVYPGPMMGPTRSPGCLGWNQGDGVIRASCVFSEITDD